MHHVETAAKIIVHVLKTEWLLFKNYCYIVENTNSKEALLIDPAWEFEIIDRALTGSESTPIAVLLTHHHQDHIHLAEKCAQSYNIPVFMSAEEIQFYGFSCTNLQALPDKNNFQIGSIPIKPIPTPGHTHGGICYLIDNYLFTGDTLFNEGCGICFGKGADPKEMYTSCQLLKNIIHDKTIVYPGHQFHSPIGQNFSFIKKHNIYLQFTTLGSFVDFRMRKQSKMSWMNFK